MKDVFFVARVFTLIEDKLVGFNRTSGSHLVGDRANILFLDTVQEWCKDFPSTSEFIVTNKSSLFALEDIQKETGVCVRIGYIIAVCKVAAIVVDFQFRLSRLGTETWALDIRFEVDGFSWLDAND